MNSCQMQDAKARLSEVVKKARSEGPQKLTMHGRPVAVVLSREEFDRVTGGSVSLAEFMRRSPLHGLDDLDFPRERSLTRTTEL